MSGTKKIHGLLFIQHKLDTTYVLNVPSPTERGELDVMTDINAYIAKVGEPITVKVGDLTFHNVYGANKMEGTPKADIALVGFNKIKNKFEDVCFISHKLGKDASDFQQYSGITWKADGDKPGSITKNKSILAFLKSIVPVHKSLTVDKQRYYTVISDKNLVGKAVYGPEYGQLQHGLNNIHCIGQGDAVMSKDGKSHRLTFSAGAEFNPDVHKFMHGDYTAIIGARYSDGRNFESEGKSYSGVRVLIMPKKLIGNTAKLIGEGVKQKIAVVGFGRLNPPTSGHDTVIKEVKETAKEKGGTPFFYLSASQDPDKNPLKLVTKLAWVKKIWPGLKFAGGKHVIDIVKSLDGKFDVLYFIAGSDRVTEYTTLLNKYNGKEFNFQEIHVVKAGTTRTDNGANSISASKMRQFAKDNDLKKFAAGLPSSIRSMAKALMQDVINGMKK